MWIIRLINASLLSLVLLLWTTSGHAADGDNKVEPLPNIPIACGCEEQDEYDMKSRIEIIKAMLAEYKALKPGFDASKAKLTPQIREKGIQSNVNAKRVEASKSFPGARDFGATTYDFGCFTLFNSAATPCMMGSVDDHESVHRKFCKDHPLGARFDQLAADYIQEEMDAYQKEMKRLQDELAKMSKFCALDKSTRLRMIKAALERSLAGEAWGRAERFAKSLR